MTFNMDGSHLGKQGPSGLEEQLKEKYWEIDFTLSGLIVIEMIPKRLTLKQLNNITKLK